MRRIKRVVCGLLLLLMILAMPVSEVTVMAASGSSPSLHMNGGAGYIFNMIFTTSAGNQTIVLPGNGTVAAVYPNGSSIAINDQLLYVLVTDTTGAPIGTILPNAIGSRSQTAVLQADGSMGANGVMVGNTGTINFWFNGFSGTTPQPSASYIMANKVWQNADGSPFTGTPPDLSFVLSGTPTGGIPVSGIPMLPGVPVLVQDGSYTVEEPGIPGFQLVDVTSNTMQTDLPGRAASATTSNGNYTVTFTNRSAAHSGIMILTGVKNGDAAFDADVFLFTVTDNNTNQVVSTGTNAASTGPPYTAPIIFTPIVYTEADVGKTFTYTVQEIASNDPRWSIDTNVFTVTVTPYLSGSDIIATPVYSPTNIIFNNTTIPTGATGEFLPVAIKEVIGSTVLFQNQFSFAILDKDDNNRVVSTGTNSNGTPNPLTNSSTASITFSSIIYSDTDIGTTFNYTLVETTPMRNGWRLLIPANPPSYDFTVSVTDVSGTIVATPDYPAGGYVFENQYISGGTLSLAAHKTTSGGNLTAGQFQFQAFDEFGVWAASGTNDANGNVSFGTIRYTNTPGSIGFHMYTIVETTPSGGGWTTSTVSYPVLVRVSDNGNGTMTVTPFNLNTDNFIFVNTYNSSGSLVLNATKRAVGGTLVDNQFQFAVVNESGVTVATGTNTAAGAITFTPINYTLNDVGLHHYSVFETSLGTGGWTPSSVVYHISVNVVDNGNGTITATPAYPRTGIVFINTRDSLGSIALAATKTVTGAPLIAGQFSFAVLDENGITVSTGTNDASGNILFSAIPYRLVDTGTHNYTVVETTPVAPFWQTDNTVFNISVTVTDVSAERLQVTANYPPSGIFFSNTFTPPDRMLTISKTITGFQGFNVFDPNSISPITFLVVGVNSAGTEVYRQSVAFNSTNFKWSPTLKNYTAILHNLPVGTYFVYERGGFAPGYTNNHNPPQSANVTNTVPAAIAFANIYKRTPVPPEIHPAVTVNKTFHGLRDIEIPSGFRINITGPGGFSQSLSLSDAMSSTGGLFTGLAPGTYTITEQNSTVTGFVNYVSVNNQRLTLPYTFQISETSAHIVLTIDNNYVKPDKAPQTGVSRNVFLPVLLLLLSAVCITGAEIYRRYIKRLQP
ncbi:MAG: hypothetical protein FWD38_05300 [Oscillospiraceae bacterium]|nr:hypothetical protein [Oscillospiraceae bacterium]